MEIDTRTVLDTLSGVVAAAAILVFTFSVRTGLSPVTEASVTVLLGVGAFGVAQVAGARPLRAIAYGVAGVSFVGLVVRYVGEFEAGSLALAVGLFALAIAFLLLARRVADDETVLTRTQTLSLVGAVAVVVAVLLVVDLGTGTLVYSLTTAESVSLEGEHGAEARVGTLLVSNPTPLPERMDDRPNYGACLVGDWSGAADGIEERVHVSVRGEYEPIIFGSAHRSYPVVAHLEVENVSVSDVPVRHTEECPPGGGTGRAIAVYETRNRYRSVAV